MILNGYFSMDFNIVHIQQKAETEGFQDALFVLW